MPAIRSVEPKNSTIHLGTSGMNGSCSTTIGASQNIQSCSIAQPQEKIQPYVNKPEPLTPGLPLFYATAMPLGRISARRRMS